MSYRKTLYEKQKGKEMHASGSWEASPKEQKLITAVGIFFAVSVIATLVVSALWMSGAAAIPGTLLTVAIICTVISFILMFVVLFGAVFRHNKEQPMEKHYYDVDYTYNGITGKTEDNTREISENEFRTQMEDNRGT